MFRYSLENKPTRLSLDEHKLNLRLRVSNIPDITEPILSLDKPPVEQTQQPSAATTMKFAMSGSYALNKIVQKLSNP